MGFGCACGQLYEPWALQPVESAIHLHQNRPAGCEHHLRVTRPISKPNSIQHAENVRHQLFLDLTAGWQKGVVLADDGCCIPWQAPPLRVDPCGDAFMPTVKRNRIYNVFVT